MGQYVIKHKTEDRFFGGFEQGPEFNVMWVSLENATMYPDKTHASTQAILLRRFKNPVQLKPVAGVAK